MEILGFKIIQSLNKGYFQANAVNIGGDTLYKYNNSPTLKEVNIEALKQNLCITGVMTKK
jgi:hypothetical protein